MNDDGRMAAQQVLQSARPRRALCMHGKLVLAVIGHGDSPFRGLFVVHIFCHFVHIGPSFALTLLDQLLPDLRVEFGGASPDQLGQLVVVIIVKVDSLALVISIRTRHARICPKVEVGYEPDLLHGLVGNVAVEVPHGGVGVFLGQIDPIVDLDAELNVRNGLTRANDGTLYCMQRGMRSLFPVQEVIESPRFNHVQLALPDHGPQAPIVAPFQAPIVLSELPARTQAVLPKGARTINFAVEVGEGPVALGQRERVVVAVSLGHESP